MDRAVAKVLREFEKRSDKEWREIEQIEPGAFEVFRMPPDRGVAAGLRCSQLVRLGLGGRDLGPEQLVAGIQVCHDVGQLLGRQRVEPRATALGPELNHDKDPEEHGDDRQRELASRAAKRAGHGAAGDADAPGCSGRP